jgi:hypothetical protein
VDKIRFDKDRAFAVFLLVATAFFVVEIAAPGMTRPLADHFAWGGALLFSDVAWMWFCIASVTGIIAGLRLREG